MNHAIMDEYLGISENLSLAKKINPSNGKALTLTHQVIKGVFPWPRMFLISNHPRNPVAKTLAQHKGYGKKTKGSSVEASICVFFPHAITSKILFWGSKMFWSADKFMLFCWDWLTQITQPVCKESLLLGRFFWSEVCWRLAILLIFPHDLGILYEI